MRCPRALSRTTVAVAALSALTGCMTVGAPGDDHKRAPVGNSAAPDPVGTDGVGRWAGEQPRLASEVPGRLSGRAVTESPPSAKRSSRSSSVSKSDRPAVEPSRSERAERPGESEPSRRSRPSGPVVEPTRPAPAPSHSEVPDPAPSDPPPVTPQDPQEPGEGEG
ncbi:hypothetical protein QNO07_06145 [Streptomyces sp. 549]|uniref:hypothetical protein n=1 Tax=Streptomyces sp. 549 TaxID=3049076 RepID=UPI0024C3F0BD|nr:hypothetical protein [Streptomyces sp. 549]MDK1473013.1 hypothetical protein [Streptomyces sp. 549]